MTARHGDRIGGQTEPFRKHSNHGLVGPPVFGRRRNLDLQGVAKRAEDAVSVRRIEATQNPTQLLLAGRRRRSHRKIRRLPKTQAAEQLASSYGFVRPLAKEVSAPRVGSFRTAVFTGVVRVAAGRWRKKWRAGFVAGGGGAWHTASFDDWSSTPPAPAPYFFGI